MTRPKAFTLIELLVVISIVSLLLSILLPSLSRARNVAYRSVCASNYRQLEVGASAYAGDSQDAEPWLNSSSYAELGYGGPPDGAGIATDPLCRFSNDYLDAAWSYNSVTGRMNIPKVMIDPGIKNGMLRPNPNWTGPSNYTPDIGQENPGGGMTIGFGSFLGQYFNNTGNDRTLGVGSNGGMNGCWRQRDPVSGAGLFLLRQQEFLNPSADVIFVDIEFQDGYSTKTATNWSIPHGTTNIPDGINQGFADGSVRFFAHNLMNTYYQSAYPWAIFVKVTPMCLDLNKPLLFNIGGYPDAEWGFQPTLPSWYGITSPNSQPGGGYTP